MREQVLQLRADRGLLGILTPAPDNSHANLGCILMNAGVIHRIGPHRLNVKLARHLAAAGLQTVRLDLSGLGDSRPESNARSFTAQAIADIRTTMDHLERSTGTSRFVISGLCSGAAVGFKAALADPRVVALQLLDPYAYRTSHASWRYYVDRVRLPEAWVLAFQNMVRKQPPQDEINGMLEDFVTDPPAEEFARGLAQLVERGVFVMCLYTGSVQQWFNYRAQFDEVMAPYGIGGRIRVELMPDSTHTFLDIAAQQKLISTTDQWLASVRRQLP